MNAEKETLSWAGGRKYVLVVLGFATASVALFMKIAEFSAWSMFVLADFGFYFGVNYAQKKSENVRAVDEKRIEATLKEG